jgi:hypothetical protein
MPREMAEQLQKSSLDADRTMSYKLRPFAMSDPHDVLPLQDWHSALPANWEDARFFRSWLVYDPRVRPGLELPRVNWYKLLGLTLAVAVSASVWAGIGLLVTHFWK